MLCVLNVPSALAAGLSFLISIGACGGLCFFNLSFDACGGLFYGEIAVAPLGRRIAHLFNSLSLPGLLRLLSLLNQLRLA